jgi:DNA-binding Lrp family transcriptional regulator
MTPDILIEQYGYNAPLFLSEIRAEGISPNTLKQQFKRMTDAGIMKRFDKGIYYFPKESRLLGESYLDGNLVISEKYIKQNDTVFGYYSGAAFANQLGVTTQVPAEKEIVTNKEATKGRRIALANYRLRLKKPRVPIDNQNWRLLQLLDLLNEYPQWSEYPREEVNTRIAKHIKDKELKRKDLIELLGNYPDKVSRVLLESGLAYVFA